MCVEIESRDDGDPTSSIRRDSFSKSTDDSPSELSHPAEDDEDDEDDVDEDDVSDIS